MSRLSIDNLVVNNSRIPIVPSSNYHNHHIIDDANKQLNLVNSNPNQDNLIGYNFSNLANHSALLRDNSDSHGLNNNSLNLTRMTTNSTTAQGGQEISSETWYDMPKLDNIVDVFSLGCSVALIFGGLIPYIPQYLQIKQSKSSEGFSTYVCLTLLIANILRIMFWFGHHFELPLLIQSFLMIGGMLAMMEICVRFKEKSSSFIISAIGYRPNNRRRHSLLGRNFWNWDNYSSYIKFLTLFTLTLGGLTYAFVNHHIFVESLGFIALFTESMLGVPQLLRNYSQKSTQGMSVEMVVMWLSGDLFKTLYSIIRHTPAQFVVCGSVQVAVDVLILIQVFWYRRQNATYKKLPKCT